MLKIKKGLVLRQVGTQYCVVPVGEMYKTFRGIINLNSTGAFIFSKLTEGSTFDDLVNAMTNEYDVDKEKAKEDISSAIDAFRTLNILEDDNH